MGADSIFDKADHVVAVGGYDYGIELYLLGLAIEPDNVGRHQLLRDIALERKVAGGKSLGMSERVKLNRQRRDDGERMLAAEKLLAYEPGQLSHMVDMARHARGGGFVAAAEWIEGILRRARGNA